MAEPRPQATCTENLVTSGHLVSNNYTLARTGIETYMQTDTLTAILRCTEGERRAWLVRFSGACQQSDVVCQLDGSRGDGHTAIKVLARLCSTATRHLVVLV